MRRKRLIGMVFVVVVGGVGCGGGGKPAVQEPAPVADPIAKTAGPGCKVVADHMATVLLADADASAREGSGTLAASLRKRCDADGWSDEARSCLATMQNEQEAEGCTGMLTAEQRKAIEPDVKAMPGPDKAEAAKAAPPPPPPPPAPSRSRGATKKKPAKASDPDQGGEASADPCQGGE